MAELPLASLSRRRDTRVWDKASAGKNPPSSNSQGPGVFIFELVGCSLLTAPELGKPTHPQTKGLGDPEMNELSMSDLPQGQPLSQLKPVTTFPYNVSIIIGPVDIHSHGFHTGIFIHTRDVFPPLHPTAPPFTCHSC